MTQDSSTPQTTPLILDLDQHLHRSALLESIQLLDGLICSLSISQELERLLCRQILLRLTYLAIHLRTQSETHSETLRLHRENQRELARLLERQTSSQDLTSSLIRSHRRQ